MNLTDIIALAKQGYKPADIRELMELADQDTQAGAVPEVKDAAGTPEVQDAAIEPERTDAPESTADAVDYKALYEQEKTKLEKLQKENIRRTVPEGGPTDQERLEDIVRAMM